MMMSLDEVMKMTNEELEKVQQAKPKFHQKHPLFEGSTIQPPPNPISSSLDWVPAQAFGSTIPSNERRSFSASRARSDNSSSNIADLTASNTRMNKDSSLYASTGSIPAKTDLYADRKIELLTKKLKYLDDHIKTLDKENKQSNEKYQDLLNQQQKAVEHQKQDRKLIQTLRDQSQQMKLKLDLLMNSEEVRDKINHNYNTSLGVPPSMYSTATGNVVNPNTALLDPNHLEEFIISKIQSSLVNTIEETILKHEKLSQLRSQQQVTSSMASQKDHNRYLIDQITIFEKELLKQKNELNSIKSKQSVIDSLYSDVKSNISVKELENLENHKKQLKNYRLEFNTLLTQTQEQLDTKINTYQSQEKAITDIREQLDNSLEKLGNLFGDFDIKLTTLEKQQLQQNNMINILKNNELLPLMDKVNEHDTTIQSMTSELEIMYGIRDDLQSQGEMQLLHTNKLTIIEKELSQLNNIIQTNTNNFELLQIEVKQNLPQQIDSKIQELSQYYERITSNQTQSIEILTKSMKKLKTKLNDIINNLKTLNSMKQQIEKLISELENKVIEEISHTYELQTTIQKNAHLSNYLNEKLINLENSVSNQEKKRLEEEKHDQQELEHVVSGLQQSIDHRISLLKDEVEQRLKSTTQTNELKQFSQEFSQFKKDQAESQTAWSSLITKQIQSQLQAHEQEIKQQCNNFQQQSRQITERCSHLEHQCESLIETMPVFNDTFSNISNKIEIIENKIKDCELEAKLLQETIQKQLHSFQEEHKKVIVKIEEEIKEIEKKNEEEGERKEQKDKDQKDKEELKKKKSKSSSSKKKLHKRDASPSSSSSYSSSAEESWNENDEGDHRRSNRKSPRKSSPKHGRETRSRYEDDDDNDEDRYDDRMRGSKDSRSQRRKGSPRYDDEEPSHSKHRRNRDRDDDHHSHRHGNSARRDRGSGGRYSQPSPSSRDHRSSKDHQNYSPRSYTSSRRHSYGESVSKPYRDDERDYDDVVRQSRSSYDKRSPKESERRFEDDMTPSQKQRYSDQDSQSKYDQQERLVPPSHSQSSRLNAIPPRPGPQNQRNNDRHYQPAPDKKQPIRYSSSPVVGDAKSRESPSVASSLRDEWHGITSDLSSPEGGMIGGGSGGRKSYNHEPSIESLDDHSQNLSKDRKGGEDEEEAEEEDDEEGSQHPSLDHHPPPTQQKEGIGDEEEDVSLPEEELKSMEDYIRSLNMSNLSSSTNEVPSSSGITNSYRKDSDELVLLAPDTVDRMTLRESDQEEFFDDEEIPSAPTFSSSPTQKYSPHTLLQGKMKGQRANIPGAINQKQSNKPSQTKQGLQFPAEVTNSRAEGGIIDYSLKDRPLLRQSTATSSTIATGIAIPSYETFPPVSNMSATLTSLSSLSLAPILEETAALIDHLKRDKESEEEERIRKEIAELEKREEEMRHKNVQVGNDQRKDYAEDVEIDATTDFAKFHELMDQLHSDIVALDLQSIKQQTFDEFYSSNKDILSSPRRALLATNSGKEEAVQTTQLAKKGTLEADEEDDEDDVGGGSIIPASDASVMNIDDKREDESIFTFESASIRVAESRPPKQIIPRNREEVNVREPSRLLAQEHFDEVVTIKSLSSDSSSSSANKKPLTSSPLSTASSASSPASQILSSPEDSKHSLNELAKTSLKELNKSLIQYYDDEDDSYLKENIIKPSKEGKQEDNREEEESSSISDQRHTRDEDSDDDESEDSLDYIQIYTPKDLNAMKQTETLAKDDIDARGSQRLPELDLLSEFESIINRPKHHSSPPSAASSSLPQHHVVSSSEKAVEATMNWQALVNEHDTSKEEVDALDIPSDIFDVNEEEEEDHHNNQDEDDISSMKDDVVIMREAYPPSSSHHASNIPHRPFSSSHQSMNISSSMLLDDFDQEVEEIKEFLESDSPPRQYHKEYQQYSTLSRSGGSVDSRSSAAIDGVLDEAQYQQRLQSLSEKKRKHRMHFIASLKQHN